LTALQKATVFSHLCFEHAAALLCSEYYHTRWRLAASHRTFPLIGLELVDGKLVFPMLMVNYKCLPRDCLARHPVVSRPRVENL